MNSFFDNSLEGKTLPGWAQGRGVSDWFFYTGKSMNPTFKKGDIIYVKRGGIIVPGDIIVFRVKQGTHSQVIVHRAVSISREGYLTRGDNNILFDRFPVAPGQIVGVVECIDRHGKIEMVPKGEIALKTASRKWCWLGWLRFLAFPMRFFYQVMKKNRMIHFLFGKWFTKRSIQIILETKTNTLVKTVFHGKTVAVAWSNGLRYCKKPFDLLLSDSGNIQASQK